MALDYDDFITLLGDWLPRQRWFGGKGRAIASYAVAADTLLLDGDPALHDILVRVHYADGDSELYQLLVGQRSAAVERLEHASIGAPGGTVYDAAYDGELTTVLLQQIAEGGKVGELVFANTGVALDPALPSRVLGGEQSNSSLVYGDAYILKLFRKLAPGINPDLEITRALHEVGTGHIAPPLGWIERSLDGEPLTLGLLQTFFPFGTEGWALAAISVRDLYAEGDLHADEVGGDFASESERLGVATAEVHRALATAFGTKVLDAAEVDARGAVMHQRLDAACAVVPELGQHADVLATAFDGLGSRTGSIEVQRIHGDYHLGQVLRTESGWVLLDFEGEPARPLGERREMASPLRDVAGMLRSFDYAARHLLMEQPGQGNLEYRAIEWAERNREAFLDGYARGSDRDPRGQAALLRAFELDKAVYEVVYEARNRPTWLAIPLGTIERLAGSAQ